MTALRRCPGKISATIGIHAEDIFKRKNGDLPDPELEELHEYIMMMDEKERKKMLNFARKIIGGVNLPGGKAGKSFT